MLNEINELFPYIHIIKKKKAFSLDKYKHCAFTSTPLQYNQSGDPGQALYALAAHVTYP